MRRRLATTGTERDAFDDSTQAESRQGSPVIRVNSSTRQVHLVTLLPLSSIEIDDFGNETRSPIDFRVYLEAAGYLALKHFNERNPRVLKQLPELLSDCNIQMTVELRDTHFTSRNAVLQFQEVYRNYPEQTKDSPLPFAILGAARSAVSQTLSVLGGAYELPQISATSTSASLDNKGQYPYFTRTVPSNAGDAKTIAIYFEHLSVSYFGVIYVRDSFGSAYFDDLSRYSKMRGIGVVAAPYDDGDDASITAAVKRLEEAGVKYIVGIFNPRTWKKVIRDSREHGIIGKHGFTWLLTEASLELTQAGFHLSKDTDGDIAEALHGTGVVLIDVPPNEALDAALAEFETDDQLRDEFISHHVESFIFDAFDWSFPGAVVSQYLNYDAVMSLGIAACNAENEFFTGPEMHQSLLKTEFDGVTGYVNLDAITGTRKPENLRYRIDNVLISDELCISNREVFGFTSETAVQVDFLSDVPVRELVPYIYFDNTTIPPLALPPVEGELNLIPTAIIAIGCVFGGLAMATAVGWLMWTIHYRKTDVVRIAQPIFLAQLCLGAFVIALSVVPMSLQDPIDERILDIACMATVWMLSLGFVTAFSALFSKTWRLNKLFSHGNRFRRIEVKARDVMYPFFILAVLNISFLTLWTIGAPITWTRVSVANFDAYGRSVESYGTCSMYSGEGTTEKAIQKTSLACILLVNIFALVVANYQCYKARNLPTDYNESFYIALANAAMLEAVLLGGPMLLLVNDDPVANFLVRSILATIMCLAILLPIFIPKNTRRARALQISGNGEVLRSQYGWKRVSEVCRTYVNK
jgi:hypothetical protein